MRKRRFGTKSWWGCWKVIVEGFLYRVGGMLGRLQKTMEVASRILKQSQSQVAKEEQKTWEAPKTIRTDILHQTCLFGTQRRRKRHVEPTAPFRISLSILLKDNCLVLAAAWFTRNAPSPYLFHLSLYLTHHSIGFPVPAHYKSSRQANLIFRTGVQVPPY